MSKIKKHKVQTQGFYFIYSNRQHPFYKDQTEKIASLYRERDNELINELNTEGDVVHGIEKFTHQEVIDWFDSILNPPKSILSGIRLISDERQKQIDKHGFTGKHHAEHPEWYDNRQLIQAAETLLMPEIKSCFVPTNWDGKWFFDLCKRDYKQRLVIAGALIAADLDRLNAVANKE